MANCREIEKREGKPELPNLVLSTTYALNKSNSKRIIVGLEHSDGYFHEVIKFNSSGGSHRNVTLDSYSWELLKKEFDTIAAYFRNSYSFYHDYGRPNKIFLPNHDLNFASSYGTKSIVLDERPRSSELAEEDQTASEEPPCKKRLNLNNSPGIVMQQTTFDGLRSQSISIDLLLAALKERVGKVNRTIDYILEYLKDKLRTDENKMLIINDFKRFKQYYSIHNTDIEGFILERMSDDDDNYKSQYLKIVLSEILAFGLPMIAKDLYDYAVAVKNL